MNSEFHAMKAEETMQALESSAQGLSEEEVESRLQKFGPNELRERQRTTALSIFLGQFKSIFVIMLIVAAVASGLIDVHFENKTPIDAFVISAIVVMNSAVGFVQEYRSEKAMEAMKKLTAPKARVKRNGKETMIAAREVVLGDIILLEAGDRVPADARLIEAADLRTDEAVLTGESTPVEKGTSVLRVDTPVADRKNMVFMATHVIYGRGKAVVISTGMNTEFGKVAGMVQATPDEETPLKLKLERFSKKLAIIISIVCVAIFLLQELRGQPLVESFMIAVALAVSAVPEGLPAIVTVTLALGARDLAKRNAVVRRLTSVETLGSTTIICSDKTGTLTKGEMTVREIYVNGQTIEVTGVGYERKGEFRRNKTQINPKEDLHLQLLLTIGTLCNNASYDGQRIIGDPTEGALIVAGTNAGMWQDEMEKLYPRVDEIAFSSERKRMTTVHQTPEGKLVAYVKGAPEVILQLCDYIYDNGRAKKLTTRKKQQLLKANKKMAGRALRVLGMAYKTLPDTLKDSTQESVESYLTFVGLVGMIDPPREEAKEANHLCEKAGIKTVMITGDHKLTAVAVAREIGMLRSGMVLTGAELDGLNDDKFEEIVEGVVVYARVSPEHKIRIVRALKKKGHIVAMTGDGVNDAPALKQADIGVAMGITGTDVSKEASDMVLADDNFATIVNAVKDGRIIYDNIRKFAFFLIRCNFDELLIIATFAFAGLPVPLLPAMILWINLVTDGGPALALSFDPPTEDVMQRPPRNPEEGILHGRVALIIVSFLTQFLGTAFVFSLAYFVLNGSLEKARTMAFMQVAVRETLVVWNCRSEKHNAFKVGFLSNKLLLLSVVASLLLTASLLYVPFLQVMFHVVPLGVSDWIIVSLVACSGFLIVPEIFAGRKVLRWK